MNYKKRILSILLSIILLTNNTTFGDPTGDNPAPQRSWGQLFWNIVPVKTIVGLFILTIIDYISIDMYKKVPNNVKDVFNQSLKEIGIEHENKITFRVFGNNKTDMTNLLANILYDEDMTKQLVSIETNRFLLIPCIPILITLKLLNIPKENFIRKTLTSFSFENNFFINSTLLEDPNKLKYATLYMAALYENNPRYSERHFDEQVKDVQEAHDLAIKTLCNQKKGLNLVEKLIKTITKDASINNPYAKHYLYIVRALEKYKKEKINSATKVLCDQNEENCDSLKYIAEKELRQTDKMDKPYTKNLFEKNTKNPCPDNI